jgi:histidyl-tRNA synthetase
MGDVVLGELLRDRGLLPSGVSGPDYFVVTVSEAERPLMRRIARSLRARGHSVAYTLRPVGMGKQFKDAGGRGAREVIVLGPDEMARGVAVVRVMDSGEEREVPLGELEA